MDKRNERTVRPRACTVCRHKDRVQIEMLRVAGTPYRVLADKFGIGKDAIVRHFHGHVTEARKAELMVGPAQVEDLAVAAADESRTVMDYLSIARSVLFRQFINAAEAGDRNGVVSVADSLLVALRDSAKITGELRQLSGVTINQNTVNFVGTPAFDALSSGLLQIARDYPAAKADIIGLLRRLDEPQSPAGGLPAIAVIDAPRGNGSALGGPLRLSGAPVIECAAVEAQQ
jgi:hypothetical protein